jgi:hypothetical protein
MAIVGFTQNSSGMFGTINTTFSFSFQQTFGKSIVWACPYPQQFSNNDDDATLDLFIDKFVDSNGTHTGKFPSIFSKNCTEVHYAMKTTDCIATVLFTLEFFD